MNAGVYFVTQNSDDLLDERLKNNIGLKFAFRSTDIHEIKRKTLEFLIGSRDESNQNVCEIWRGNGQCLMQDLYGRVGCGPSSPVFEGTLFHAFYSSACSENREEEMKKKLFRLQESFLCSIINLTVVLSLVGTIAVATSLVDDTVERESIFPIFTEQLSTRFLCG